MSSNYLPFWPLIWAFCCAFLTKINILNNMIRQNVIFSKKIKKTDRKVCSLFGRRRRNLNTVAVTASRFAKAFARVLRRLPLLFARFISHRERSQTSLAPFCFAKRRSPQISTSTPKQKNKTDTRSVFYVGEI